MDANYENLQELHFQYKQEFEGGLQAAAPVDITRVATVVSSGTDRNVYAWLNSLRGFREWVGPRIIRQLESSKYELKNKEFEDSFEVKRREIEDDQYGIYGSRSRLLGEDARRWPYEQVFQALLDGDQEPCYDNQNFFDDAHPVVNASGADTVASNNDTGGPAEPWFLLDTNSRSLKPLLWQLRIAPRFEDLVEGSDHTFMNASYIFGANARGAAGYAFWQYAYRSTQTPTEALLRSYRTQMAQIRTPEGKKMGIRPNLIVTGPSNIDIFEKLLKRPMIAEGGVSVSNVLTGFEVLEVPYLG